ncbi:MAG: hypothetical protein IJX62_05530 [Clostridia bacterium]|nr:hypothetical protein [Clostridia bacterium]
MQLDKRMLEKLLTMNDEQLAEVIRQIAAETGIDPAQLGLNPQNIQSIRQALGMATDEDLKQLNAVYDNYKQSRRPK